MTKVNLVARLAMANQPAQLTPELIDYYVAQGRRERSRLLLGGLARALGALRRHVSGQPTRLSGQVAGRAGAWAPPPEAPVVSPAAAPVGRTRRHVPRQAAPARPAVRGDR